MKKVYAKPTAMVIRLEAEQVLATSIAINNTTTINTSEDGAQLSNKKDGMWGDNNWGGSPWE